MKYSIKLLAKLLLIICGFFLFPSLLLFYQNLDSAINNGTAIVVLISKYGISQTEEVHWKQAWSAFTGPILMLISMLIWWLDSKNSKSIIIAAAINSVGIVFTFCSILFKSLSSSLIFFTSIVLFISFVRLIYAIDTKFGRNIAVIVIILLMIMLSIICYKFYKINRLDDATNASTYLHTPKRYKQCGISLNHLSILSGAPGDVIILYGTWGNTQEEKLPTINKGTSNKLEILSWTSNEIKVRIPNHLKAGNYKVGVYCNDPYDPDIGGAYSTVFVDFRVSNSKN